MEQGIGTSEKADYSAVFIALETADNIGMLAITQVIAKRAWSKTQTSLETWQTPSKHQEK